MSTRRKPKPKKRKKKVVEKKKHKKKRKRKATTTVISNLAPPKKKRKIVRNKKNPCKLGECTPKQCTHCEYCHHVRFIKFLVPQSKTHVFVFKASLLPYVQVVKDCQVTYGIRKGEADFFVGMWYKCPETKVEYEGLVIELKVGNNKLTVDETVVMRENLNKKRYLCSVCYGFDACKKLFTAYRDKKPMRILEEFCWAGKVKKGQVL
jgi:hypothetical protein